MFKMHNEVPIKPRRKKVDVLVHQSEQKEPDSVRRSFSANHPKRNKHIKPSEHATTNQKSIIIDEENSGKISKRHLIRENEKLTFENNELQEKLTSMDLYINKKNNKFKERLNSLQVLNQEMTQENIILKNQYEELMSHFRTCQNELDICRNCQKCVELYDTVEKQKNEFLLLSKSKEEMNEDLNMLKNVVYRLNVQLERYQQKLHKSSTDFVNRNQNKQSRPINLENGSKTPINKSNILSESHKNHPHTPVSWGRVNAHTLGPLLDAYQETIAEKEGIIEEYEQQLTNFTERMREIIRENENLHILLNEDEDCSKVLTVEMENIKGELKSSKEQNDLLIKKCALKQDKNEEILKCYEQKFEIIKRDYKVLQEEYYKSRTELTALREKNKSLLQVQTDFKNERQDYIPLSVHSASVNECKKWYEELKHQYEQEREKLKQNITEQHSRILEMTEKISEINKEKITLDIKIKAEEKQFKKLETKYLDLQHTLNSVQLSRSACRKQLHKAMNFAKDLVTEQETLLKALNQRQKENKVVKRLGSDIVNRMDTLRSQLKTVQQEAFQELSTVEHRMQEQDSIINSLKREHNEEVERLKQIIREREDKNMLLKENTAISMPHYFLFKEKNIKK